MWLWHDLLAALARLAGSRPLGPTASRAAPATSRGGRDRLVAGAGGQRHGSRGRGGEKTGPNPTDRRRPGSKHHIITDGHGIPLALTLTAANRHDVTQLLPLVDAIPPIGGKVGAPRRKPDRLYADRAYDSAKHRLQLWVRGIEPVIPRRNSEHGSGLGMIRWVVERSISWLHQHRRLRVRYERRDDIHEAFLKIAAALNCWKRLQREFC